MAHENDDIYNLELPPSPLLFDNAAGEHRLSPSTSSRTTGLGLVCNELTDNQETPLDPDPDVQPPPLESDSDDDPLELDDDSLELDRTSPEPDEPLPDPDLDDELHITLEKLKMDQRFIDMARAATLDSQFSPAELGSLRNPKEVEFSPSDDPNLELSIEFYISSLDHNQSQNAYSTACAINRKHFPGSNILSYNQVKRRVSELSGVVTWKHDMCINSCAGFTGPFASLESCPNPDCSEYRYDQEQLRRSGG